MNHSCEADLYMPSISSSPVPVAGPTPPGSRPRAYLLGSGGRLNSQAEAERLRPVIEEHVEVVLTDFELQLDLSQTAADLAIVAAGMEGALPGVVASMVSAPVIGVPVSTGYGAAFGGVAALLGMLNSCASGLTVVNIDNGFGAGYMAAAILASIERGPAKSIEKSPARKSAARPRRASARKRGSA